MRGVIGLLLLAFLAPAARAQSNADFEDHCRAGFPLAISRYARPSDTGRYVGTWIGGGNPWLRHADPPIPHVDGTWGWDFLGGHIRRRVILGWWHGRKYQGGVGAYDAGGPTVLPPLDE